MIYAHLYKKKNCYLKLSDVVVAVVVVVVVTVVLLTVLLLDNY